MPEYQDIGYGASRRQVPQRRRRRRIPPSDRQKKFRSTILWIVVAVGVSAGAAWMMKSMDEGNASLRVPLKGTIKTLRDGLPDRAPWHPPAER